MAVWALTKTKKNLRPEGLATGSGRRVTGYDGRGFFYKSFRGKRVY